MGGLRELARPAEQRGRPPGRPPSLSSLLWPLLRLRADLLEESHRVEVVAALLDLVALEGEEEGSGRLLTFARGRDSSFCGFKRARVRALTGHFQGRRVAACDGACHRADGIRERRLPALEQLDDLLRTLDLPLGSKLVVVGVGGEHCL